MKKSFLLAIAFIGAVSLHAQKNIVAAKVPAAAREAFAKAHPAVTGKWENEDAAYEVTFKESGKDMSCVIDKAGNIQETETVVPLSQLPAPVTAAIAKKYKGVKVKEAATIVKADGTTIYEAQLNGKDVLFDAQGNAVKKKKDND